MTAEARPLTDIKPRNQLRILAWPSPRRDLSNPYIALLYGGMDRTHADISDYSVKVALAEKFDVLHLHWPDWTIVQRAWWRAYPRLIGFMLAVTVLRVRRTAVVWTVHNLRPHQSRSRLREWLLYRFLSRTVDRQIHLSHATHGEMVATGHPCAQTPFTVVPHGYLADPSSFPTRTDARTELGVGADQQLIVFVGGIDRYKGVDALITAFTSLVNPLARLIVAGRPYDDTVANELRGLAADDSRVQLDLRFLPDEGLKCLIAASDLTVLPYTSGLNSGTAFLALAGGSPLLVPATATFLALRDEVGECWVTFFQRELRPRDIELALMTAEARSGNPSVATWERIAAETVTLLASSAALRQHRRTLE
ncbi:glycosyltransferase [uncultured Microbacterium sp.]|uniref:glycosyltransferase n=1 Tax=uncultured Microbacterium sp. TaxID=191216 RepID=UPI0028D22711|nr:glycosyltransferase [uncultured Microbacterium sp.]